MFPCNATAYEQHGEIFRTNDSIDSAAHCRTSSKRANSKPIAKFMKRKEESWFFCRESREFREFRESGRGLLAEFELLFVDFQGLDSGLERRGWNSQLSRRPGQPGNPAPGLSQRRLDNLPLGSRTNGRRRFNSSGLLRTPAGEPRLVNRKNISRAQDDESCNYVL